MKINKIDIAGLAFGALLFITAWARYIITPSDYGETILFCISGIILILVFWNHHLTKTIDQKGRDRDIKLDALETWVQDKYVEEREKDGR